MKKFLLMLLALVMIVSAFAACGDGKGETTPKATTPKQEEGGDKPVEIPENQKLNLDIDAIDHNGEIVRVVHWDTSEGNDFGIEEDQINNDAVNDALYKRNLYTERDLGVELDFCLEAGTAYNTISKFMTRLEAWKSDPNTPVDIIAGQARMLPHIMIEGYLIDLNLYTDSLDFDKAWWPADCVELYEVKGDLYFITGDISANLLRNMTVIFTNKKILESRGFSYEEFMETVKAKKWTLDELIRMTEGIGAEGEGYDGNPNTAGPSKGDMFGMTTSWKHFDALYMGCGFNYMTPSNKDNEVIKMAADMYSQTVANWMTKVQDWQKTGDFYCGPVGDGVYDYSFKNGFSLFTLHRSFFGFDLQTTDLDYAIVPTPMLDESQGEYFTAIGHGLANFGICEFSTDYDRAAQTMQVLGYHAYNTTTPAVFEVSFKGKFSKDDYTIEMFDIIREAITVDVGRIYDLLVAGGGSSNFWPNYPEYIVSFCISGGQDNWTTDKVWTTEFGTAKQLTMKKLVEEANSKLLAYIGAN